MIWVVCATNELPVLKGKFNLVTDSKNGGLVIEEGRQALLKGFAKIKLERAVDEETVVL